MSTKPIIGISMGDPAGIGPEIIVKGLSRAVVRDACRPIVVGDTDSMLRAIGFVKSPMKVRHIDKVSDAAFAADTIEVLSPPGIDLKDLQLGTISAAAGNAAFQFVKLMIELALAREIDATVTAPIHKEALMRAGHQFPGHTEIFAHFTGTRDFTMMLAAESLRVVHVSTHVSLRHACDAVKRDRVLRVINLAHDACHQLGIAKPHVGVAGLNPHASDGGMFGAEERDEIIPAVQAARASGINADGPHPPDTFFAKANSGAFDICVAMYHDQGHIPVKCRGFHYNASLGTWDSVNGINVSLGLPIIRTSVDHGTAFDQAGKGTASDASLLDAIDYAVKLAMNR